MKCEICGRKQMFIFEGHVIDGSWAEDYKLPKKIWGKWVCSFKCYKKLLSKYTAKTAA